MIKILFVCGMSGAGKTTAQNSLEDLGYMCIDNMPPTFISLVVDLIKKQEENQQKKIGFIFDVKFHSVKQILETYNELKLVADQELQVELVFLDATDKELLGRYRETRRKHPLSGAKTSLAEGIKKERELLRKMRESADVVIDTTELSTKELTLRINALFGEENSKGIFNVTFMSFGFKYDAPSDADFLLDVRFLPNPFYDVDLRIKTGQDAAVRDYVLETATGKEFMQKTVAYLDYLLAQYQNDKRNSFIVAIGCTGGQHRSVAIAEALYKHFKDNYVAFLKHRDMDKNTIEVKHRYQIEQ